MARAALRLTLALVALRCAAPCTYDQAVGTGLSCAAAPLASTTGNEEDAPGGVVNLGGTGEPSVFAVLSDWGGQAAPPYTTAGQVLASKAMNAVCNVQACKAVLSAGNNFMPSGLPGDAANASLRVNATWRSLYGLGPALAVPWYLTGGFRDWEGNVTGERDMSEASTASGVMTWHYPGALLSRTVLRSQREADWPADPHCERRPVAEPELCGAAGIQARWDALCMPAACSVDALASFSTLQVIMVDTVLLLGEMEPGVTGPPPKTPLKAAQPAATATARPMPMSAAAGVGTMPATGGAVPLTPAGVALPLSYPAGAAGTAAMSASSGGAMPLTSAGVALPVSYPAGGLGTMGARRLLDFNSLDDPPKTSSEQWAWLEARYLLRFCLN